MLQNTLFLPATDAFSFSVAYIDDSGELLPSPNKGTVYVNRAEAVTLQVGKRVYPFLHGDAIYVPPFEDCRVLGKVPTFSVYKMTFDTPSLSAFAPTLAQRCTVGRMRFLFSFDSQRTLLSLCDDLLTSDSALALYKVASFFSILEQEDISQMEDIYEIALPVILRRALEYIDTSLREEVTQMVLAERYGVSESTVMRLFRTYLDTTPKKHLYRQRVLRYAFLSHHGTPLADALDACGFSSAKELGMHYKRMYGKAYK